MKILYASANVAHGAAVQWDGHVTCNTLCIWTVVELQTASKPCRSNANAGWYTMEAAFNCSIWLKKGCELKFTLLWEQSRLIWNSVFSFFFFKIQVIASTTSTPSTNASASAPSTSPYDTRASTLVRDTSHPPYLTWVKSTDAPTETKFSCYSKMDATSLNRLFPGIYVKGKLVQFRWVYYQECNVT